MTFGDYVRNSRKAAGLSLRHVAASMGISHVYASEVERGLRPPFIRERWPALVSAVPGLSLDHLARLSTSIDYEVGVAAERARILALGRAEQERLRSRGDESWQLDEFLSAIEAGR